ncbi:hypothetical protein FHS31_000849 [Sphingomonas vulcanisoli]|uniref:DUF4376 domain-containing protein n=1 Tax=Sphingomonas vulcanisoli TaxID=1658060 RepID=A0ABX0TNZ9_9SPHN|nr:DUF4376 domain-containing protein [Sphingomonas vulcanisoli]NIJ07253.1 hypothetical protein [Sphingomonas vulcanisoli]
MDDVAHSENIRTEEDGSRSLIVDGSVVATVAADATQADLTAAIRANFPSQSLANRKERMLADLAALRWTKMQTCAFGSRSSIDASDTTASRIAETVVLLQATGQGSATIQWKFGVGDFQTMTLTDLVGYGGTIAAHWQLCFANEETLDTRINGAEDHIALDDIDITTGWPA